MSLDTKIFIKSIGKENLKLKGGMGSKWVVAYMFNSSMQIKEVHPIFMFNVWFKIRA
jgi:hypothetical protein